MDRIAVKYIFAHVVVEMGRAWGGEALRVSEFSCLESVAALFADPTVQMVQVGGVLYGRDFNRQWSNNWLGAIEGYLAPSRTSSEDWVDAQPYN